MYLAKANNWELWPSVHPTKAECHEGEQCTCKYHIISDDRSQVYSFEDYQGASDKWKELTGSVPFNPFKQKV